LDPSPAIFFLFLPGFFDFWLCDQTRLAIESQIRLANNCHFRRLLMTTISASPLLTIKPAYAVDLDQSRYSAVGNQTRYPAVVYQTR